MERPKTLSATFVRTVSQPGRYGDGRGSCGLYLRVRLTTNGRIGRSWGQRLRIGSQLTNLGLGSYPAVSLALARTRAVENAQLVSEGGDPRIPHTTIPTFEDALETVIGIHSESWKESSKTAKLWRTSLENYAIPQLRGKLVSEITTADVLACLLPIWAGKRETAMKVRRRIRAVMQWAIPQGYRDDNPAGDAIDGALPKSGQRVQHQKALPHSEVTNALDRIRTTNAWPATKLAFQLLTLTATRSNEVRQAAWTEIDLDGAMWTIPSDRMKGGSEHRIPLSRQAVEVLRQALDLSDGSGLVFPSPRGKALTDSTISKLVRESKIGCVPHGMRSSFRDWCGETGVSREVAEACLAHVVGNATEQAYNRSDLYQRRTVVMQSWADYATGLTDVYRDFILSKYSVKER